MGQCPECEKWNSFEEQVKSSQAAGRSSQKKNTRASEVISFENVSLTGQEFARFSTGMEEFDRVLGGGIVFGSVVLIGGEPGIGKSTLLTHLALNILKDKANARRTNKVLYCAGEESPQQIAIRIKRMSTQFADDSAQAKNLLFSTSTDVDEIIATIEQEKPTLAIVDSIQTMSTQDLTGSQGSIGQLKECTDRLTACAKRQQVPIFLVGHVTKEGTIAGPKVLEHIVDAVLELSGERTGQYRLLRAIKNRFGPTDEVGVFEVVEAGMAEVKNPSAAFLENRVEGSPGSAIACVIEGTRPLMIEVQALVIHSPMPNPRRVARGIPVSKIQVLAAVLEKFCGLTLSTSDIYVNVAGGFTITETAADLGLAMAIASSYMSRPIKSGTVYVGEVGLLGEVRKVKLLEKRLKEGKRLGFTKVIAPPDIHSIQEVISGLKR